VRLRTGVGLKKMAKTSFPAAPRSTARYRGPERRGKDHDAADDIKPRVKVSFDAKGNPVWDAQVDMPRRREGDDTIDLLKCLDTDALSLAADEEEDQDPSGYDPYRHTR
jgi:hypothetical protein